MKNPKEIYLGDGLFARDCGYHIELWCDRENGKNWVALEPVVLFTFLDFVARVRNVKIQITGDLDQ